MDRLTDLLELLGDISESLKVSDPNPDFNCKEVDVSHFETVISAEEGSDLSWRVESRKISRFFSRFFYDKSEFLRIIDKFVQYVKEEEKLSVQCKINSLLLPLVSCILNYRTSQTVFRLCPDIAVSIAMDILENFFEDDGFVIEKLLLAKRLENNYISGRKCSRLLRESSSSLDVHSQVNKAIECNDEASLNTIIKRIKILSRLSDVLKLRSVRNLVLYSTYGKGGKTEINCFNHVLDDDKFKDICKLSKNLLNKQKVYLKCLERPIEVTFEHANLKDYLSQTLIRTRFGLSKLRGTRNMGTWVHSSGDHESCPDGGLGDYVVVKNSDQTLSKLLFVTDISRLVVVYGESKKFYISLLSNLLRMDQNNITNVYTDDATDVKSLVGNWVCTEGMGRFKFTYGVLARAMKEGRWLIFDSYLSNSIYSFLVDVCESGSLFIKELNQTIYAHENFQVFILRSSHPKLLSKTDLTDSNDVEKVYSNVGIEEDALVHTDRVPRVFIEPPTKEDIMKICTTLYPNDKVEEIVSHVFSLKQNVQSDFEISLIKLIKFVNRLWPYLQHMRSISVNGKNNQLGRNYHLPENLKRLILFDFYNVFVANLNPVESRVEIVNKLGKFLNVEVDDLESVFSSFEWLGAILEYVIESPKSTVGDNSNGLKSDLKDYSDHTSCSISTEGQETSEELSRQKQRFQDIVKFGRYNNHVLRMVYSSFIRNEPVLLVGETGTGKTAIIQMFSEITGNQLKVFVFSDNSDSSDLIGSYYPVECEDGTGDSMDVDSSDHVSNSKKKTQIRFQFNEGILIQSIRKGYWLLLDEINLAQQDLLSKLYSLLNHVYSKKTRGSNPGFSSHIKREKRTLELYEYIDEEVEINENFRLFACMNPPIIRKNDAFQFNTGKKELPPNFSKIFTSIYVDPISKYHDLLNIAQYYTRNLTKQINFRDLCEFYLKIKELSDRCEIQDGSYKMPNFTLRNFVRSVQYIVNSITRDYKPATNIEKVVYDSIYANFICTLAKNSVEKALTLLPDHLRIHSSNDIKNGSSRNGSINLVNNPRKHTELPEQEYTYSKCGRYVKVFDYWIRTGESKLKEESRGISPQGSIQAQHSNSQEFVLCSNNSKYLLSLARIVSAVRVPILLQGPTAAGKTSLVKYLCEITNHTCVRINNHQHTDITEYIGQFHYRGDRMVFEYGTLVVAMKYGYWVILDELNLASSEILECLNRILDDNREIYISETNEVIKCHEDFMIFATQNPCDSIYGGRNQLAASFTNRFIQIFFDEISNEDLKVIVHHRSKIPISKSEIVVDIYDKIRQLTINSILFQKNQILITTRDLIKLANRIKNDLYREYVLVAYYSLIAEKLNDSKEKEMILDVLNKHFYKSHDKSKNLSSSNSDHLNGCNSNEIGNNSGQAKEKKRKINEGFTVAEVEQEYIALLKNNSQFDYGILKDFFVQNNYYWIDGFTDRIVYLVLQAIVHREHVLLVGETGIGKTTIVQLLARFLKNSLNILNCNHNTESADFIGSISPCNHLDHNKNETGAYSECPSPFKWVDGPVITSMIKGEWFLMDEISLAEDAVLEKLNSILEFDSYIILNNTYSYKSTYKEINENQKVNGFKGLSEENSQIRCVRSHENFTLFATMNPGNDFGKKEISPSLSNRFTQIYVPPIPFTDFKILSNIITLHNSNEVVETWFVSSVKEILEFILSNAKFDSENNITIRNVIIWSNYYFKKMKDIGGDIDQRGSLGLSRIKISSFVEGLEISILNSYKTKPISEKVIYSIIGKFMSLKDYETSILPGTTELHLKTTLHNCNDKVNYISVLLEGNPGVGKTYNVHRLAKRLKKKLVRINLNEYTDLSDLIGTYLPCSSEIDTDVLTGSKGETDTNELEEPHKESKTLFKWINGPLLECMVNGDWIMLDELNLASSEILEGLNSILDHRREIYIPQINRTINCHPEFRLFATQNPVTTTNYRKNLPKSFLNRFIKVAVNELKYEDFHNILEKQFPKLTRYFEKYINFANHFNLHNGSHSISNSWSNNGYGEQWNIRDLINIFKLIESHDEQSAVNIIIVNKLLMTLENKEDTSNFHSLVGYIKSKFGISLNNYYPSLLFNYLIKDNNQGFNREYLRYLYQLDTFNSLVMLHRMKVPILIVYDKSINCSTEIIDSFHKLITKRSDKRRKLKIVSIYENSDINDVVGGYEQVNDRYFLNSILESFEQIDALLSSKRQISEFYQKLKLDLLGEVLDTNDIKVFLLNLLKVESFKSYLNDTRDRFLEKRISELLKNIALYNCLMKNSNTNSSNKLEDGCENINFKWVDSDIIKCVEEGNWLVIKDVHMISSSLIDRLNSLLDPERTININECGYSRVVRANKDFRVFFTVNKEHFDKLSNAFVNRCIQLDLNSYKFTHSSGHIVLDELIESFVSNNQHLSKYKPRLDFKMSELYNVVNTICRLNRRFADIKYKKDLTVMGLLFLFLNRIYNIDWKFIVYLSKCLEFQADLKRAFLTSLDYYNDLSNDNLEQRECGLRIIDSLCELQSNEILLIYDSIGHLLNQSLQNISGFISNLLTSYTNIYSENDICVLWYSNVSKKLRIEIEGFESIIAKDYEIFKSSFLNEDRDMEINDIRVFLLLTKQTNDFRQLINDRSRLDNEFLMKNLDSLFFYKFLESFNNFCDISNDYSMRNSASLFSMYISQKLFKEFEYEKPGQIVYFSVLEEYNIGFPTSNTNKLAIADEDQLLSNSQNTIRHIYDSAIPYETNAHIYYLEKFVMKRVVFATGLLFHKYLVGDRSTAVLRNYISNLSELCDKLLCNIGDFLKESIVKICGNISLYEESQHPKETYIYRILFDVYDLYNRYLSVNSDSSNYEEIVNYLEYTLLGRGKNNSDESQCTSQYHDSRSLLEDWDLVFYIINMDKTNNLNNLRDNINSLKTVEYLNRLVYNENAMVFQFTHLLHNIEYVSCIARIIGFDFELKSLIRHVYLNINSYEKIRSDSNNINTAINDLENFVNNLSNLNLNQSDNKNVSTLISYSLNVIRELVDLCNKIKEGKIDRRASAVYQLFNSLIHFGLMIVPEINGYMSRLQNELRNQSRIYEIESFNRVYKTFNILDSISFGYALNNQYIVYHLKSLSLQVKSGSASITAIKEQEKSFPMILDFVTEYNNFKDKYLNLSKHGPFEIENLDETKAEGIVNFLKHIRIKYYKINSIIDHTVFTIQSIIFNYRLLKLHKDRTKTIERAEEFKHHLNMNMSNSKNIIDFTKLLMVSYKTDRSQFVKLIQLYLFHVVNQKRKFNYTINYNRNEQAVTTNRFHNYIIILMLNHIKNTKKTIQNDSNFRIEYRLNKLQKQLLNKISENEELGDFENRDSEMSEELSESGIIFDNDLIVKSLINESDFVLGNKFELERLRILTCVFMKMLLNQHINYKYNNLVQMSVICEFIQNCNLEYLIYENAKMDSIENERGLILSVQTVINEVKNDLSLLLVNYEDYPVVTETQSFIENLRKINIKRVVKDWNITSYLQNLKNKLEKLVTLSKGVQGTNFKNHLGVVEQIINRYNTIKIDYLRKYDRVVLDNHKVVLFNNLFTDLMLIFEHYISNDMNTGKQLQTEDLELQLNKTKEQLLSYLFNNNIITMLLLRPVVNTLKLTLPESLMKTQLIQLCEYVIYFTKDYEREVKKYIEELNKEYNENVKSYNNINEANIKKLVSKYNEGLKINFGQLFASKMLTADWNVKKELEVQGELSLMIKNNFEYLLNNSKELNQLQYRRIILSTLEHLSSVDLFKSERHNSNKRKMELEDLLNYKHFEIVEGDKVNEFYEESDSCFNKHNSYINRSLNHLFGSLNVLFKIAYIKTNYDGKNEEFNIGLFDKMVNKKTLIVIHNIVNTVYHNVMNKIQKFKGDKLNIVVSQINKRENKPMMLTSLRTFMGLISELECSIHQQIASSRYGLNIESGVKTNKFRFDNITEVNKSLELTQELDKYLKSTFENTYLECGSVEDEEVEVPVRSEWLDNTIYYLEQIERCLTKMVNNVPCLDSIKIIRKAKAILNHHYVCKPTDALNDHEVVYDNCEIQEEQFDIEGHKMIDLCEFVHEFTKFIELFIHIRQNNEEESMTQEGTEYVGGVGLDEGEGIKNISKQVEQDELNLEEMTNKEQNQDQKQLPEEDNIDFDFNDEIDCEDIHEEKLDDARDLELDEMEDDYSSDKKQQQEDQLEGNEQVNLEQGEDYDAGVSQQDNLQNELTKDELEGYTEHENKDDQTNEQAEEELEIQEEEFLKKLEEDLENEELKSEGREQLELDDEITSEKEETLEQEQYAMDEDEKEIDDEDLDQESKFGKKEGMTQEAAETNLMVVYGLYNNMKRTMELDNLYGVPNNRFDNIINDLEQFNLNDIPQNPNLNNTTDSKETQQYSDRYQPGERDEEENKDEPQDSTNEFRNKKMEQLELKFIKQSQLNRETEESDLYEFHNEAKEGQSNQGLSNTNFENFEELENEHKMNVDNEESVNDKIINEINQEREKPFREFEVKESEMDIDKDYEVELKDEDNKTYVNKELLVNNEKVKLDQIEYLKKEVDDQELEFDLEHGDISQLAYLSNNLMNHLRMILQYNQINSLKGYYKHGKRISIKKLMVFIATNYQKDKIWLKRLKPTKRNYYIQIAMDNTKSMSKISQIAIQTIHILYEAINKLNIGTLNIIKFGAYKPEIILNNNRINDKRSWMSKLTFNEESKDSYENGLIYLFQFILSQRDFIASKNKILIIIADGKFNKNKARKYIINTINNNVVPLLVVLDPGNNITTMKHIINKDGNVVIENYLDNFPFPYYSIINNINKLPNILSDLLRYFRKNKL